MALPVSETDPGLDRFQSLWQRCLLPAAADHATRIYQQLVEAYREPQRHYHTLEHIVFCLNEFDQCRNQINQPDAVEMCIWFHDAIYQPGKPQNEKRSADWYLELATDAHAPDFRDRVYQLIIATIHDQQQFDDVDFRYMVDIDLSSFGLPWPQFLRDSDNLRQEASHLQDEEYYRRQNRFQQTLLERPRFFLTDHFYHRYENQARDNLARFFKRCRG